LHPSLQFLHLSIPAMPTTLYLVRHGETDANVSGVWQGSTDSPLNARGQTQARALARRIAREQLPISLIYSSPLRRARQTAEFIAEALDAFPIVLDSGLAEYHLGEWEGLTYEQLKDEKHLWDRMAEDPDFMPPGGESPRQFATRLLNSIQTIVDQNAGETVAVVGHGGALATALSMILDQNGAAWRQYQMLNASLSKLVFDPDPRLEFFSDISHLQDIGNLGEWQ